MANLEGYVDDSEDGVIRVHSVEDPRQYLQVAADQIAGFRDVTSAPVAHIVLRAGAEVTDGRLDDDAYNKLFTLDPATSPASASRETAYPHCYSWNPPGGGGFCLRYEAAQ